MCATQGLKFLSFLGFSQNVQVCPFDGVTGCRDFPKTYNDLVRSLYYTKIALATGDFISVIHQQRAYLSATAKSEADMLGLS